MTSRTRSRTRGRWRVAQIVFAVVLVVGVFVAVIPQIADYGSVWQRVAALTAGQLAVLVGVAALNLVTYWAQSIAAMPGLTIRMAAVQNQTTTTVADTVPAAGAVAIGVSYGIFRSWGQAGVPTVEPRGFLEIDPDREYLLMTSFLERPRRPTRRSS